MIPLFCKTPHSNRTQPPLLPPPPYRMVFHFISIFFAATGIKAAQISEVLEAHNRLRSQVAQGQVSGQPSAQNMREMVWDEELAAKAQQWANQCTFEHDPSRYLGINPLMHNFLYFS